VGRVTIGNGRFSFPKSSNDPVVDLTRSIKAQLVSEKGPNEMEAIGASVTPPVKTEE
jgi:hypothetical protein